MQQQPRTGVVLRVALLAVAALVLCCSSSSSTGSGGGVSALQQPVASSSSATATTAPTKVLVTGASGRTGRLVFAALLRDGRFEPRALVRSERSAKKLKRAVPGTGLDQIVICDVVKGLSTDHPASTAAAAGMLAEGCEAMVICTSAVPVISKVSLLKALLKAPINLLRGKKAVDFRTLQFVWKYRQYPELVDYRGQVAQIDLAKQLQMKHVVVVSSMGGTDPGNFLNSVGKNNRDRGGGSSGNNSNNSNGDILLWKRKAERYLVASGLDYTILHPGGLVDDVPAGTEEFVLDVDDRLMRNKKRSIGREDVANLCVAALALGRGRKVSLDCITAAVPEGGGGGGGTVRTAEEALADFMRQGKTCDYAL